MCLGLQIGVRWGVRFDIMNKLTLILFLLTSTISFAQINHTAWDGLVKKYVDAEGNVDYKGIKGDTEKLNLYLKFLENNSPKSSWTENEIKAYWINAYNAYTVKIVLKHYPIKSIKDVGGIFYKVNTTWDIDFIEIGGQKLSLNDIEHKKLRGAFDDPRIHAAVNCASFSCPKLRNEAYEARKLEAQLNDQAKVWVNDPTKNDLSDPQTPKLSKIFSWYSGDFEKNERTLIAWINQYSKNKLPSNAEVDFLEYNWSLNEQ